MKKFWIAVVAIAMGLAVWLAARPASDGATDFRQSYVESVTRTAKQSPSNKAEDLGPKSPDRPHEMVGTTVKVGKMFLRIERRSREQEPLAQSYARELWRQDFSTCYGSLTDNEKIKFFDQFVAHGDRLPFEASSASSQSRQVRLAALDHELSSEREIDGFTNLSEDDRAAIDKKHDAELKELGVKEVIDGFHLIF